LGSFLIFLQKNIFKTMKIKWGILGAGHIAEKFASDMQSVSNGVLYGVASQTEARRVWFKEKFGVPKIYDSYIDLLKDPEIEAIYVATPHNFHFEHVKLSLENKKAVLCEKPITVNLAQLLELQHLAQAKGVLLMEALWTYFLPTFKMAKQWIDEGKIGKVTTLKAEFGFKAPYNEQNRVFNANLAGGALLDIGIYPIAFAYFFAQSNILEINSMAHIGKTQIDEYNAVNLSFESGELAILNSSVVTGLQNDGFIYGSKGYIHLPYFWKGTQALLDSETEKIKFEDKRMTCGYNFETEHFANLLLNGQIQSDVVSFEMSKKIMNTMDTVRKQNNFKYPFE
jgi:predicted dehydrogenase